MKTYCNTSSVQHRDNNCDDMRRYGTLKGNADTCEVTLKGTEGVCCNNERCPGILKKGNNEGHIEAPRRRRSTRWQCTLEIALYHLKRTKIHASRGMAMFEAVGWDVKLLLYAPIDSLHIILSASRLRRTLSLPKPWNNIWRGRSKVLYSRNTGHRAVKQARCLQCFLWKLYSTRFCTKRFWNITDHILHRETKPPNFQGNTISWVCRSSQCYYRFCLDMHEWWI